MPSAAGPIASAKQNLVFAIDTHDMPNGATLLGCGGFNGSTQGVKDLISGTLYTFENGMKLTNRTYYTVFAIDYPEGNYGGDAANRHGITPGYDVRSGAKLFGYGRALHYSVYDNITDSWVKHSTYDSYIGTGPVDTFVSEYATAVANYPNATHVIAGSHRDSNHTAAQYAILRDLGAPSNVDSIIGFSAPEWILIGKPGLGAGNAFGWVFQNYPTNSDFVAHINFGLPIKATGGMEFDGTNDYINLATNFQSGFTQATYEFVCKPTSLPTTGNSQQLYIQENSTWISLYNPGGTPFFGIDLNNGSGWFDNNGGYNTGARTTATLTANQYYHVVYSWNGTSVNVYLNGTLQATASTLQAANGRQNVTTLGAGTTHRNIGSRYSGSSNNWVGSIDVVKFYNTALTTSEVQENYKQYKTRFNLS